MADGKTSVTLGGKQFVLRGPTIREIEAILGDIRRDLQAEAKRLSELEGSVEEIRVALETIMGAAGFVSGADDAKSDRGAVIVPAATPAPRSHHHAAALRQPAHVRKSARRRRR